MISKRRKLRHSHSTGPLNGNYAAEYFPGMEKLKVVVTKYDDFIVQTYFERSSDESDTDSSGSKVDSSQMRHGHRLRINSSSSQETEESHTYQLSQTPESSAGLAQMIPESRKLCHSHNTSPLHGSHAAKRCTAMKELKVVLTRCDVPEAIETESNSDYCDTDSSGSAVYTSQKQRSCRLKINSSSSDEEPHTFHLSEKFNQDSRICFPPPDRSRACAANESLHKHLVEDPKIEMYENDDHNAPLSPDDTVNITSALNTAGANSQCYSQEDEIIAVSSDDEVDCSKIPPSIRTTEPAENDLSNSESKYLSNLEDKYERGVEISPNSEVRNVSEPVSHYNSVLNSASEETNPVTKHQMHQILHNNVGDEKAPENLQQENTVEPDNIPNENEEQLLSGSENIENITRFLYNSTNNKSLPEVSFNGSISGNTTTKIDVNDSLLPLTQSFLSHDVELQGGQDKSQKPFSKINEVASITTNSQKPPHDQVKEGSHSSKNKEFDTSLHSKPELRPHAKSSKQSSKNHDRTISEVHRPLTLEEQRETSSAEKNVDAQRKFCKKQKGKTSSKTKYTEAVPMQYRPRYKRGREEWFTVQSENDKPTENKVVLKEVKANMKTKSKSNAGVSPTKDKNSMPKSSGTVRKHRSKHSKNSSLRDQMQNKYRILTNLKSSAPVVSPSSKKQTCESANHKKNIPSSVEKKSPLVSEDPSAMSEKGRKVVMSKKPRFSSRMSFFTDDVAADGTGLSEVDSLRSKTNSLIRSDEVPNQKIQPTEESSVWETSQVPKHEKALTPSHIHSENSSVLHHSIPQIQRALGQCVPTRNLSASQVLNHHHQTTSGSDILTKNPLNPHFKTPKSCDVPVNSSVSDSFTVHTHVTSGSSVSPAGKMSISQTAKKVPPPSSPAAQISDPRPVKSVSKPYNTFPCNSTENTNTLGSPARASNVGVVVSQKASVPELLTKLTIKLSFETFLLHIFQWNTAWLSEQERMTFPPPIIEWERLQPLNLCYKCFDDYASSFYNLLLVEVWESLFQAWKHTKLNRDLTFIVTSSSENSDFVTLDCESLNKTMPHYPIEGTLLIINLRMAENQVLRCFAYCVKMFCHCKFHPLSEVAELDTELKEFPECNEENPEYCKFRLKTKNRLSTRLNKRMKGYVLSYIPVSQQIVNSLVLLQSSPLIKDILCPQEKNCTISTTVHPNVEIPGRYNKAQTSAIIGICDEMRKVYPLPRILLLQGPPGTGKTQVIIGIIENLLSKKEEKIKILVTAPSNAAADEIGRRLIALRRRHSSACIKPLFVRVGTPDQIHTDIQPFSLDSLLEAFCDEKWSKEIEEIKAKISATKTKILDKQVEISSLKSQDVPQQNIKETELELCRLQSFVKSCEQRIGCLENKTIQHSDPTFNQTKLHLLKDADVMLCTLSSCRQSVVENAFGEKSDIHFTCCIIDEASQCTELEALQPLAYGMCKLLLVGDREQLPATVRSRVAVENHLERSLFERIHSYFDKFWEKSPVYKLTEQYRMHS